MSGYNYDFVDTPPDRLLCKICNLPCRDPRRTVCCGHVFCESELTNRKEDSCPECEAIKMFTTFVDKADKREIKELKIYCPNKDGCSWIGELSRVDEHLRGCEISCSKCKQILYLSTMKSHLDTECPCYCPYCDMTAEREVISSEHKENCHKFPLTCPNNCGLDNIPRDNMDEHKKVCPLEMIQCEYQCGAVITRNEVTEHNEVSFLAHIHAFKNELNKSFQNITDLVDRSSKAELNIACLFSNVAQQLDSSEVTFNGAGHVDALTPPHAELQPSEVEFTRSLPTLVFALCSTLFLVLNFFNGILLMQKININNDNSVDPAVLTEMDERLSIFLSILTFKCHLIEQPPSDCDVEYAVEYWSSRNVLGIMLIAPVYIEMPDFDRHRINNVQWYSPPFFAYEGGYALCLRVYTSGTDDGKGTHISVYLHLMKGPHDDKLQWPMRAKYAINLIDPTNNTKYNACNPYVKYVIFNEEYEYNRITAGIISYYGMGYDEYIDMDMDSTGIALLSNLTIANSFLTKRNSLLFQISYYTI